MLEQESNTESVLEALRAGQSEISGLQGSSCAYLLSRWFRAEAMPLLVVVTATTKQMMAFAEELAFYDNAENVYRFPPYDTLPYFQISPHRDVMAQRMKAINGLLYDPRPKLLLTSIAGLASPVVGKARLQSKRQVLRPGDSCDRDILASLAADWGYQKTPLVEDRGTYAVRGGIVDIWGPLDSTPWRIELLGDEIDSIRRFHPQSQKSLETLSEVWMVPVKELLWDETSRFELADAFVRAADEVGLKATEKRQAAERIRDGLLFGGAEHLLPFLEPSAHITDYFPEGTQCVLWNEPEIRDHLEDLYNELLQARETTESVERVISPELALNRSILDDTSWQTCPLKRMTAEPRDEAAVVATDANEDVRWMIRKQTEAPLSELARRLQQWQEENRVVLVASSTAQRRRLLDLFEPYSLALESRDDDLAGALTHQASTMPILLGELSRGFRWPGERLIIITDEEVFGPKARRTHKETSGQERFLSFGNLKDGDPLIHEEHGIGLYRGMQRLQVADIDGDFLLLEYAKGDKLYVPAYRMNQVQPYAGGSKPPRLDRMGGASWHKVRDKAQKAIRQLAGEILNLYAARAAAEGFAFREGSDLFEAFEASFPYEETEDQARTIQEVLADMAKPEPMDRLVLGDVGYGKTEVAMRAAFKAALNNKQTAILVPTTVLAFQHYRTFCERFKDYPVAIGLLSRFQSRQEMKDVVEQLRNGKIDILIGTHRMLQTDVTFQDLGLLVIDEEHRFGVMQKEKIKQFKKTVDVLALSATPIPRTLNMAMTGLRGISVIETPPTDRLAIRTYVTPYSDATVKEAIEREMRRGGQVFYVHNRIHDLARIHDRLKRLLPHLRIAVAHGQMKEVELEETMIAFSKQEYDVLLCTTIIESGIDIPTANTILIERADELGLAQVYQLRGRVGRGSQRAYSYLLLSQRKTPTPEARKRMAVLQRFSELGSGFRMACHDLEIRGAGNVLGAKQTGHLEAIGYELYLDLLEQAISELKGETILESIEPELHLQVTAGIPEDYVPDPALRLDLYRRLAALSEVNETYLMEEEIVDRFGPLPAETETLLRLMLVKIFAKKLRLRAIHYSRGQFVYSFDPSTPLAPEVILARLGTEPDKYRLTPEMKLCIKEKVEDATQRLELPRQFLQDLAQQLEG